MRDLTSTVTNSFDICRGPERAFEKTVLGKTLLAEAGRASGAGLE
jgi:hypothetical protein